MIIFHTSPTTHFNYWKKMKNSRTMSNKKDAAELPEGAQGMKRAAGEKGEEAVKMITIDRHFLYKTKSKDHFHGLRTNVLLQPLGTWHSPPSHLIRCDPGNRMFYVPTGDGRWQQVQKDPLRLQQDSTWTTLQITSEEPCPKAS
jgi:hypothetical protein